MGKSARNVDSEPFFVQIKEPTEVRRSILESLKEILGSLKRFEEFKHLRHEKLEKLHKLDSLVTYTNKLMGKLKVKFPQTGLSSAVVKEVAKQSRVSKRLGKEQTKPEKSEPKEPATEAEKLDIELSAIEGKLKRLA